VELELGGVVLLEELELDGVLLDEDGVLLEPAPAVPLGLLALGALDEDEDDPPLALSFLLRSIEVDEELELGGVAVVPPADDEDEPDGEAVEPAGAVLEDELERSAARSHAVISDAPSARETATAIVESLMRPPWLGYRNTRARIGPRLLRRNPALPAAVLLQFFLVGCVSLLRGPAASPRCWKSRCCAASLGSTCP
jgi:hypothetical protein